MGPFPRLGAASQTKGPIIVSKARGLDALEQAFATIVRERAQVLVVLSDGVLFNSRGQFARHGRPKSAASNLCRERIRGGGIVPELRD